MKTGCNINESNVQRCMHCMTWKKCIGKKKRKELDLYPRAMGTAKHEQKQNPRLFRMHVFVKTFQAFGTVCSY